MSTDPTTGPTDPISGTGPGAQQGTGQPSAAWAAPPPRRLLRRTDDRMLGGVCSGLADYLGLDVTLVRILTVLVAVLGFGSVIVAYLVAWLIVPAASDVPTTQAAGAWSG